MLDASDMRDTIARALDEALFFTPDELETATRAVLAALPTPDLDLLAGTIAAGLVDDHAAIEAEHYRAAQWVLDTFFAAPTQGSES